jgi:hypothetical protein
MKKHKLQCWGQFFASVTEALHDPRCGVTQQTYNTRLKQGYTPSRAIMEPKLNRGPKAHEDESSDTKRCTKCEKLLHLFQFTKETRGRKGVRTVCKQCGNEYRQTPKHKIAKRNTSLKSLYGITAIEYTQLLESQNRCCAICGTKQPVGFKYFVVDHCHGSGNIRGLLCNRCNVMIGMAKDRPEVLQAGAKYLNKHL